MCTMFSAAMAHLTTCTVFLGPSRPFQLLPGCLPLPPPLTLTLPCSQAFPALSGSYLALKEAAENEKRLAFEVMVVDSAHGRG